LPEFLLQPLDPNHGICHGTQRTVALMGIGVKQLGHAENN
jgi:hypothetical protein